MAPSPRPSRSKRDASSTGSAATSGPIGLRSPGALDGEVAFLAGTIEKTLLFSGGVLQVRGDDASAGVPANLAQPQSEAERMGWLAYVEGIEKAVAALLVALPHPDVIVLSGRVALVDGVAEALQVRLSSIAPVRRLDGFARTAKHAAQGAALLADGLAGGRYAPLVDALAIREARGTVLDHLVVISPRPLVGGSDSTEVGMRQVLLVGVTVRALAESAARAGYGVMAIDSYSDVDLRAVALAVARCDPFVPRAAVRLGRGAACDTVVYGSPFENDPRAIMALVRARPGARGRARRALWGNVPVTVRRVRNPIRLAKALAERGFAVPAVRATLPRSGSAAARQLAGESWLIKPKASGGGRGVRPWHPGDGLPRGYVLQQRMRGVPGSIVFAADGRRVVPLALTRMLVGERRLGATGFRYCGNILTPPDDPMLPRDGELLVRATALATAVTRTFVLVGINGIDFIARAGIPYPIEVNPRPTAAAELAERAYGLSIFTIHARANAGALPAFDLDRARCTSGEGAVGKAIVYARRAVALGDTTRWLDDQSVRDIPPSGSMIAQGNPICTVFAEARTGAACLDRLLTRARRITR